MAVRNVELYVDTAIQSVLSQKGVSFELLIGDDASGDRSWSRVQAYERDSRVGLYRFRMHRGAGATRNQLIARAKGKYISICDADDWLLLGSLKRLAQTLDRSSRVGVVNGPREILSRSRSLVPDLSAQSGYSLPLDLVRMPIPHQGAMFRKRLFKQVGGYDTSLPFSEDFDLFLKLGEVAQLRQLKGKSTSIHRIRRGSLSDQPPKRVQRIYQEIVKRAIFRRTGLHVPWAICG